MVLLCAASGVSAQAIYRQADAEGHITYTDRPDPAPSPQTATDPVLDVMNALASHSAISSLRIAMIDANEAARRLEQAELERKRGAEPLPGEQARGTDASVVNQQRYQRRQEELRRVVEQAQRRASETSRLVRASP